MSDDSLRPSREPISKKLRFEIFKRDSFTCQYCGKKAPDVILHCDHIKPVAEGGTSDILNLLTSCVECNLGKAARTLAEHTTLTKQMDQLAELQTRREQIEMLIEWREGLANLEEDVLAKLAKRWSSLCEGAVALTPTGMDHLRRFMKEHGIELVMQAMQESLLTYGRREGDDHQHTKESLDTAFGAIGRVAKVLRRSKTKPYLKRLFYIRGILRKRLDYLNEYMLMDLMEEAVGRGIDLDSMESFAKRVSSWTQFKNSIEDYIREHRDDDSYRHEERAVVSAPDG
jgi:HNH endonuclease